MRWTPYRMSQLEWAVERQLRVSFVRRGTEYVVTATALRIRGREEVLLARVPVTGETQEFVLTDLEEFVVLDG